MISTDNPLLAAWSETLARNEDRPAMFAEDARVLRTFSQVENEATLLGTEFQQLSSRAVVALQIRNSPCWPALLIALWRRGLTPLPVGDHLTPIELETALEVCRAAALVTIQDAKLRVVPRARTVDPVLPEADFLKLTSGTTSAPRAIRFRAEQLVADCTQICTTMGITDRDVNYGVIPMSHSYGFSNLVTPLLCHGVPLVVSDDRLARAILDGLVRTGATVFPGMPLFFQHLAESTNPPDLPRLRLCISAGAPLTRSIAESFAEKFGRRIHVFYGSSECGGIAYDAVPAPDAEDGFVGTTMRGVTINRIGAGDRIEVRSEAVGEGYFPNEDRGVLGGGRFVPGDLVRFTERGLVLVGRESDVINIAGRKLNPIEVEQRLMSCPGVRQACVFGVPSSIRGEEPIACVAGDGLDPSTILRYCRTTLSPWQMPRDVWIVAEIPANERGKVSRRALAERYGKELQP